MSSVRASSSRAETATTSNSPHRNRIVELQVKKEENGLVSEVSSCGRND